MINDNNKTKICKKCGRELPLERFGVVNRIYTKYVCKDCFNEEMREKRHRQRIADDIETYYKDTSMQIQRKYKDIHPSRILTKAVSGINYIARGEKFVSLLDYKSAWVSSYGRIIIKDKEGYKLLKGSYSRKDKELYYTLDKNVYFKTKKEWGYKKVKVSASDLVIQTFIVNYDMQNNTKVWHTDNNMKDNYYKHLYPVTELQYEAIKKVYDDTGVAAEEQIMSIVNSAEYKYNGWNPKCFKRTYEGKGYIGTNDVDCKSPEYLRWTNMIQRCYNKNVHKYKPYYKDKKVCEEWLNFANFRIWYREHIIEGAKVDLDKDILCQGNKVYSPETCVFVEHYINTVFEDRSAKRRIVQNKEKRYEVYMIVLNKNILFGTFDTKEEAEKGYITGKKDYILKLADSCKGKVQDCLYNAMVNWNVGIAD